MPSTYLEQKFSEQNRTRKGQFLSCETCKREFYVPPSRIKYAASRGMRIRYCAMACYKKDGANNPFWGKRHHESSIKAMADSPTRSRFKTGSDNPNFVRYGKDFTPKHPQNIKPFLVKAGITACQRCGWDIAPILELHHKDRNRKNNTLSNLEFLCPNCHTLEHYLCKDGPYHSLRSPTL